MNLRVLIAFLFLAGCGSPAPDAPVDPGSPLGEEGDLKEEPEELKDDATMVELFDVARHVLYGEKDPKKGKAAALPGRRAFVCAYTGEGKSGCGTGVGDDLRASVSAAAQHLASGASKTVNADNKANILLKIDVVTRSLKKDFNRDVERTKKRRVAAYGYWVEREGQSSFVLPSEVLERRFFDPSKNARGIRRDLITKALKARNPALPALEEEWKYDRIYTSAWIETATLDDSKGVPAPLYRTHQGRFDDITPDLLLQRTVWAADYLVSSISPKGKIRYNFRVNRDSDSSSYNLLRHGGTTYSILQMYDRTRYEPYRLAAEAALEFLFKETRRDIRQGPKGPFGDDQGESIWILSPGNKVKLGGAGLALVAIDQYVEATGDTEKYREEAEGFARFLVASMKEDGEFIYFPSMTPDGPPTSKDGSEYYPGEAIYGLVRMYSWDKNPLWLKTASDGADWLIDVRDKGKNEKRLANDHWLMLGLAWVYKYTGDEKYLNHSLALTDAVNYQYDKNKPAWKEFWDFQGGYYDPPRSTPAATRGEGLGAVLETCLVAKKDCPHVRFLLEETVKHENLSQYDTVTNYWMKRPARSFGGWNGGLLDPDVRNDFVQHNMSSALGLERAMRREQNSTIPGSPGWTEKRLAGEVTWSGVPPEQMKKLQTWSRKMRGDSHWDELWAEQQ
jgi:hypothetical protein